MRNATANRLKSTYITCDKIINYIAQKILNAAMLLWNIKIVALWLKYYQGMLKSWPHALKIYLIQA